MSLNSIEHHSSEKQEKINNFLKNSGISVDDLKDYINQSKNKETEEIIDTERKLEDNRNAINQSRLEQEDEAKKLTELLESQNSNEVIENTWYTIDEFKWKISETILKWNREDSIWLMTQMISFNRLQEFDKEYFNEHYNGKMDKRWYLFDKNGKSTSTLPYQIESSVGNFELQRQLSSDNDEKDAEKIVSIIFQEQSLARRQLLIKSLIG